jgi:hypothetical protein
MGMKDSIFIDCSRAGECCDKSQYKEASVGEKIKMLFHMVYCKPCRKYSSKNSKLTELVSKSDIKTCSEKEKKMWKEKIDQEITKKEA